MQSLPFPAAQDEALCDSHVHLFLPMQFPYAAERSYTPAQAGVQELAQLHRRLGIARTVLVQPSCYGTDNRALLAGLQALGPRRARGIAVLDLDREQDFAALARAGVRGVRLNFSVQAALSPQRAARQLQAAARRLAPWGWHLQLHAGPALLAALAPALAELAVPVVLDHFGGGPAAAATVDALLRHAHVWVKLSAPYRAAPDAQRTALAQLVRHWAAMAPQRLVWGSDWPHTGGAGPRSAPASAIEPFRPVDAGQALQELARWLADPGLLRQVLAANAARLYGF